MLSSLHAHASSLLLNHPDSSSQAPRPPPPLTQLHNLFDVQVSGGPITSAGLHLASQTLQCQVSDAPNTSATHQLTSTILVEGAPTVRNHWGPANLQASSTVPSTGKPTNLTPNSRPNLNFYFKFWRLVNKQKFSRLLWSKTSKLCIT